MSNIPQTNTKGLYLTSTGKGSDAVWTPVSSVGGGGSTGITALTGDVTATGSGAVAAHVVKINGSPLGTTTGATVGYVLAWDGTAWSPSSGGTGNATQIQGKAVSATAPTDAQTLIYNNSTSTWVPKSFSRDITTTNTGAVTINSLQGYTLDISGLTSSPSNGSLLGYSTTSFSWSSFAAPTAAGQMLYWNTAGWIQTATPGTGQVLVWNGSSYTAQTVLTTSSTATGDLASSLYSNLTVNKLQGYTLNVTGSNAPSNGSLLGYSTTSFSWSPFAAPTAAGQMLYWNTAGWVQTATPGTGQILQWNGSSYIAVTPVVSGTTAAGDLTGTYPNPTIAKLQNNALNLTAISNGNFLYYSTYLGANAIISTGPPTGNGSVMYWNGGYWTSSVSLSNGQVLQWNGSSYTAVTPILSGSSAGGDLTGTYPSPTIANLQGKTVSASSPIAGSILAYSGITNAWVTQGGSPTTNQILAWTGSAWGPIDPPSGGAVTNKAWAVTNANGGLPITANTILAPATPNAWNVTVNGFSNYLVTATATLKLGAATATTVSIGINVNSTQQGGTSGVTVSAIANQTVNVVHVGYLTGWNTSTNLAIQGFIVTGVAGTFYNGTLSIVGIS
jgi:hypothetical protein